MRSTPSTEGRLGWPALRAWWSRFACRRFYDLTGNHILTSLSLSFLSGRGGLGGSLGSLPRGVSGRISLGGVPSLRTAIEPRLEVILMLGPSPTLPFSV